MFSQLLTNLLFSFNAVIPVFLIITIGMILKRKNILTEHFSTGSNKLVFTIALPAMIFESIYTADFKSIFDPKLISFSVAGTIILFFAITLGAYFLLSDRKAIGAFVQGSYRSNFVIIGIPLIKNLSDTLGATAVSKGAIIISFIMPLYNILAVIILATSASEKTTNWHKRLYIDIAKNPLIIAVIVALPFSIFDIHLPVVLAKSVAYLSAIAVPLALLDIGTNFNLKIFMDNLKLATIAACIKIAISPLVFTSAAFFFGFRGADLGVLYILFASPTAVSSYIMAKSMKNDSNLAANIVLISTFGSIATIFLGVFTMKSIGWIP